MLELNKTYNMDCLEGLKEIEDNSVDLVVTSPPYGNLRKYNGFSWDFEGVAKELYRVTKDGGVVVWVVGDATVKGSETGTSFRQALYFKGIGFNLYDTMIYEKTNPIPGNAKRYTQSFEYMFVLSKGLCNTFNPVMEPCKYAGCGTSPKIYDINGNLSGNGRRIIKDNKVHSNIFRYTVGNVGNGQIKHPAVFPLQLATDHIVSWSNPNDIILDPFMGSGTTAVACINTHRNFIGFELSKEYCDIASDRCKQVSK